MSSATRRALDVVTATLGLMILSPLLVTIAIAVSVGSPGGPFFRQVRVGRNHLPFRMVKFRTMTTKPGTEDGSFDPGDATRVTEIGRFLRRTKLDELPQLWNVLGGDMSLVGPRPEVPKWTRIHPERWDRILGVRPGITDPASLEFRGEENLLADADDPETLYREVILPRKLELSETYVRERSLPSDVFLIFRTLGALLGNRAGSQAPDPRQSEE